MGAGPIVSGAGDFRAQCLTQRRPANIFGQSGVVRSEPAPSDEQSNDGAREWAVADRLPVRFDGT